MEQFNTNDLFENDRNDGSASEMRDNFIKTKLEKDGKVVEVTINNMNLRRYSPADLIAQYYQQV